MGRTFTAFICFTTAAATIAGCSSTAAPPAQTVTVTQPTAGYAAPAAPAMTASEAPAETAPAAAAPAATSWVMPNLIGKNLQAAQNAVQSVSGNPLFYSTSTDLTGKGRMQVQDRNWQVCSSTPPPGATFSTDTPVDFGVVRIDSESCP